MRLWDSLARRPPSLSQVQATGLSRKKAPPMIRILKELYQYRRLLLALTQRELKARSRGSALGFLWTFLNPALLMLVYAFMFGVLLHNNVPHYPFFLFVGLLPWIWFPSSVGGGASTISD